MSIVDKIAMRKIAFKGMLKNNRGQAVLEYVLLTFIVVLVLGHMITGLAHGTQEFAKNYFGSYFQCLLETGELPQLGADNVPETECDELHEPFTFREGRPVVFNDLSGPTNGGADVGNSGSDGSDSDSASAGSSEGSGSSTVGAGEFGSDGFSSGRSKKVPLSAADKSKSGTNAMGAGANRFNNFQQDEDFGEGGSGRSTYVPIYGNRGGNDEENQNGETVKADIEQNPEQALRGKRVPVSVARAEIEDKQDEPMTLPDFLKIIIIAAILLVIFIFFGGQVMQYNKSKD